MRHKVIQNYTKRLMMMKHDSKSSLTQLSTPRSTLHGPDHNSIVSLSPGVVVWTESIKGASDSLLVAATLGVSLYRLLWVTSEPALASIFDICNTVLISFLLLYNIFLRMELHAKKELLEAKRHFCRFVSHEVRGPLNSVGMGLTLLLEEINAKLEDKAAISKSDCRSWLSLTKEINANVESGVDVLSDFLNYDKIESGKLMLENSVVPIFDLIQSTAAEFKTPVTKKRIMLSIKTPLTKDDESGQNGREEQFVIGDKARLTQVVRNLISNALKFAPDEGDVTIEAAWSAPVVSAKPAELSDFTLQTNASFKCAQVGSVVLTVTDTGAGMTKEQIEAVFEEGTQFNANELQNGKGSGLGTFIAQRIVQQHNGTLTASSKGLNQGSTFSVSLPVYDVPCHLKPERSICSSEELKRDRCMGFLDILVVDDSKMNAKLLRRLLSKRGHLVEVAEDGDVAVEKVRAAMKSNRPYDVILMDYMMPRISGPQAVQLIRQMGCSAFIVGVTGCVMQEDVNAFHHAGANTVLPKPIKMTDLESSWVEYSIRESSEEFTLPTPFLNPIPPLDYNLVPSLGPLISTRKSFQGNRAA